jgi:hypothetical protein
MTGPFTIGIDLGPSDLAVERAAAAVAAGATLARVRFKLGARPFPDAQFLEQATQEVRALRATGLAILAVIDGHLTVAPAGVAAFGDSTSDLLAAAWADELVANAGALASAIGPEVAWWEVLPGPNVAAPPLLAPGRWAELLARVARAVRAAAPGAAIASGGLVSDESDDGVEYLRGAWQAAEATGVWPDSAPPFDAVGLRLAILPDGGSSEEAVGAAVRDRVQRLWRALETLAAGAVAQPAIIVTDVGWSAERAGETAQARNLWVTLDTLSTDEVVRAVIWESLQDDAPIRGGLFRAAGLGPDDRRPAWQAFNDFCQYLRQIAPPSAWIEAPGPGEPHASPLALRADESAALLARLATDDSLPEPDVFPPSPSLPPSSPTETAPTASTPATPERVDLDEAAPAEPMGSAAPPSEVVEPGLLPPTAPEPTGAVETRAPEEAGADALWLAAAVTGLADRPAEPAATAVPEAAALLAAQPPDEPEAVPGGLAPTAELVFRIPTVEEVLRARGLDGPDLGQALAAVAAQHGDPATLPPGEYRVHIEPPGASPAAAPPPPDRWLDCTNQQMISALYRAGGGSWALFERSGLVLGELAGQRNAPYTGPALTALGDLTSDEQQAVLAALAQVMAAT